LPGSPAYTPDLLQRLFERLVANLASLDPAALHRPVPVGDIADRLIPYRTHRATLGVDTNEDYEMTVLRLLSGERGFAQVFPDDVRSALEREAAGPNPDTGIFRHFPTATFLLDADRVADLIGEPPPPREAAEPREAAGYAARRPAPSGSRDEQENVDKKPQPLPFVLEEDPDPLQPPARPREIAAVSAPCPYCGGNLPVGRTVLFCPHCGQNIGVVHCPTCGSELDVGWLFCITCGQKVTGIG